MGGGAVDIFEERGVKVILGSRAMPRRPWRHIFAENWSPAAPSATSMSTPTSVGSISDRTKRDGRQARRGDRGAPSRFFRAVPEVNEGSPLVKYAGAVENCSKSKHFSAFVPDRFVIYSSLSILRGFYSAPTWRR